MGEKDTTPSDKGRIEKIQSEIGKGMSLAKCRKCGCMKESLENLQSSFISLQAKGSSDLLKRIQNWSKQMKPIEYACLGCKYCFPAVAMNIFYQAFPEATKIKSSNYDFQIRNKTWPIVAGEYFAFCEGITCPIAVSTLSSIELAESLAKNRSKEICIVGKTETENIGVDKVVKNIVSNPTIRILLVSGKESNGHNSGSTLIALWENGVDENMQVIGSTGSRPVLRNVSREDVETFRKQVKLVDMVGEENIETIGRKIREIVTEIAPVNICQVHEHPAEAIMPTVSIVQAEPPEKIEMDKAGYFVIMPQPQKDTILVEHYSYDNKLQRIIEGKDARSIYWTIIENNWITLLSHAAYLGKELAKAELSIKSGRKYVQDGA